MKNLKKFISVFVAYLFVAAWPSIGNAQTWKPICVNGNNTTGAHNNTWQKVNTPSFGGGTWKSAGKCAAPAPPPPPPPPIANPFGSARFDGTEVVGMSAPAYGTYDAISKITFFGDAVWQGRGSYVPSNDSNGRWFDPASGATADQFEISWTTLEVYHPDGGTQYDESNYMKTSAPEGSYSPFFNGYYISFITNRFYECFPPQYPYAKISISVRLKGTAQTLSGVVILRGNGGGQPQCYGGV